ncbi:MAG: ABC transporter substrate-binding protein [Acidimicrobiia bacterium]
MMKRATKSVALSMVLALVLVACGGDTAETTTTAAGGDTTTTAGGTDTTEPQPSEEPVVIRAAVTGGEGTLNPYTYVSGFPGWNLLMLQYDSLMQFDAAGEPQPWLAESVEASDDLTEWTITLVEGVTWHDGEPLTISDVEFTFNYFVENAAGRFARNLSGVESVTTDGDRTMTVTLGAPNPAFDLIALADIPIIPQHIWESVENPQEHVFETVTNVGSGPFKLVEYTEDQSYRFVAFEDYFRGAPAVDELVVVVFADDSGPLAAIRSGEIDVIFERISPEQIQLLDAQDPIDVIQGPEFTTQMVNIDVTRAPFDDVAVRQAISLAIDRQDIVDTVYLGSATVGSPGWIHPDKPSYNPAVAPVHDVSAANALLDGAGYADSDGDGIREFDGQPMSFEMLTNSSDALRLRISELVAEMLAEIGIQVNVASVETSTWEEAVWPGFDIANGRNYQMAAWGWSAPIQANTIRVAELVHSDPGIGFLNLTGFSHPQVDDIAAALQTEADPEAANALLADLQVLIAEQLPFIMLAYPDGAYAFNSETYADWEFIAGQGIVSKVSLLAPYARP